MRAQAVLRSLQNRPRSPAAALCAQLRPVRLKRARLDGATRELERGLEKQQGTDLVEGAMDGAKGSRGVISAPEHVFVS